MEQGGQMQGSQKYAPKFNRDCNSVKDTNEKIKCYEEFYNNAQVQVREDFREGDGSYGGECQSQQQIENLKQDCKNRGQDAIVEDRGGCPWVICVGGEYRGEDYNGNNIQREVRQETIAGGTGEGSGGIKCPDGVCDSYERINSFACPEDCGGARREERQEPREDYQQPMQPENRIDEPQQPPQNVIDNTQQPPISGEQQTQEPEIQQPIQEPISSPEPAQPSPSSEPSAPITGGVIGTNEGYTGTSGNSFWVYWFGR